MELIITFVIVVFMVSAIIGCLYLVVLALEYVLENWDGRVMLATLILGLSIVFTSIAYHNGMVTFEQSVEQE